MGANGINATPHQANYNPSQSATAKAQQETFTALFSGLITAVASQAAQGALPIGAGAITGAGAGAGAGEMSQQQYLNEMRKIQNEGAALQAQMFVIQQQAQNQALTYQGVSNSSKTVHDTEINTVRNVRA